MKIDRLLEYDLWATSTALQQVRLLSQDQFVHEFAGPFTSVRQQTAHLLGVPDRYRARIMGEPVPDLTPESLTSPQDLLAHFNGLSSRMREMAPTLTETRLQEIIRHDTRGGVFVVTVEETLLHVVNHGTFHRGQIACLLKLHGIDPVNTDLILWPQ